MRTETLLCLLALATAAPITDPAAAEEVKLVIDDFEQPGSLQWSGNTGVPGKEDPLKIVPDPQRKSNVLRAKMRYTSGPIFLTKTLAEPLAVWRCKSISFWYKLTTNRLSGEGALICRLRTGPESFTDYVVATGRTIRAGEWVRAEIDTRRQKHVRNIYNSYFSTAKWMTLRLEGEEGTPVDFEFSVDDVVIEFKEPSGLDYKPRIVEKAPAPPRRAVLIVKNSAAGYYNFEDIVRSLPLPTSQQFVEFRGLHFPIFGFPESRGELMRYGLIILVDVDPYVMPMEHVQWISDFVASGGGLLFCGGPNTFGHSKEFKRPLADLLPVEIRGKGELKRVNKAPGLVQPHYITSGIPTRLGTVGQMHLLRLKPGARLLLDVPPVKPSNWAVYSGGGQGELAATPDAQSGRYAASLVAREFYMDPKSGKPTFVSLALIQGRSNGYLGRDAYVAEPNTRYDFSFYLKGDAPSVEVGCLGWNTDEAEPDDRQHIKTTAGQIKPESSWRRYEGSFTTEKDTRRFVLAFRIGGSPATFQLGRGIVVDDVVVRKSPAEESIIANGECETVEPTPVLVVGTFHAGRTAVLNTYPEASGRGDGDFFTSDFYDDLMRQTLRWLLRAEGACGVEQFTPPPRDMTAGEGAKAEVLVRLPDGDKARVVYRCLRDAEQLAEREVTVSAGSRRASFDITTPGPADESTESRLVFEIRDAGDRVVALRDCRLTAHPPLEADIRFRYGKSATAPGKTLRFRVSARQWTKEGFIVPKEELSAAARIVDSEKETIRELASKPMCARDGSPPMAEFTFDVPDLSKGEYHVVADLRRGDEVVSRGSRPFDVVDRLDLSTFYPVMSVVGGGGGHQADEELIRRRVDDLIAHGFNVAAVHGVRSFKEWGDPPRKTAVNSFCEAYAQTRDMALIYEYESYTNLRRDRPVEPCVHSAEYPRALRRRVEPYLQVGTAVPRLISIKVTDEPHAGPKVMDHCDDCRRAWRERFGTEMRKLEDIPQEDLVGRRQYIEFVRDYVAKGYRIGHRLKTEADAPWDLLLTYCSPAYGYARDLARSQEDLLWWSATADRNDFDVYPYFYPVSDKIVFLQAHFCMAQMRDVSRRLKKPWGFYVELDDRNYPVQINPVEASSECAMTAVAHGADYLNSFINRTFGTGNGARPARWDHLGKTLEQIRSAGPLLNVARPQRSRLALLLPYTHWQLSRRAWAPHYAYQLLLRSFGAADVVHEEVARREGGFKCKALALLETDYLPDDIAVMIADFVEAGGILLCDRLPRFNQTGAPCKLPAELFAAPPVDEKAELAAATKQVGKGQTVLYSRRLEEAYRAAVQGDDLDGRKALRAKINELLFAWGLRPSVLADDPEFDVGLRQAKNTVVLVAVNHHARETETGVTLFDPPARIGYLADALGRQYEVEKVKGGVRFSLTVPARSGLILIGSQSRPAEYRLEVLTPTVKRGGQLRYRIVAITEDGSVCKGQFVPHVRVIDPRGQLRPRYAPGGVTTDGVREITVPVAVNAPRGKWRIELSDRFTHLHVHGQFRTAGRLACQLSK